VLLHGRPLELVDTPPEGGRCAHRSSDAILGNGISSEPRVVHYFLEAGAASGVRDEHHAKYVSRLRRDVVWEGKRGVDDVLIEEIDVVTVRVGRIVVKGEIASEHGVEDNPTAPDVNGTADIEAFANHELWGGVAGASAASLHEIVRAVLETVGEAKVSDYDVPMPIEKEVL